MHEVRALECERTRQWVSAALDSELSQFERALVHGHVARCAGCRSFEERVTALTAAVRAARPERMNDSVHVPARRRAAWQTTAGVARLGSVAAVVVTVISVGLLAESRPASVTGEQALIAAPLARPAATNDLVVGVSRTALTKGENQALAYGSGGIGAYKPALAATP
jgi:predicted anti-sigma-YlaC factor YlaD